MTTRQARILVIEDDAPMCELLRETFAHRDYHVDTAPDGLEGLEAIRNNPLFDLAILDMKLPHLSGAQLLRYLKHESPQTEVIIISAYGSEELRLDSVAHGAFTLLQKPFAIPDLVNMVDRLLQPRRGTP